MGHSRKKPLGFSGRGTKRQGPHCRVKKEGNGLSWKLAQDLGVRKPTRSETAGDWLLNSPGPHGAGQRPEAAARLQDGARGGGCQRPGWRRGARARAPGLSSPCLPAAESAPRAAVRRLPFGLGGAGRRPPRTMRLLGWWQVLLWVLGPPARGQEVAESRWSEEQPAYPFQVGAVYVGEEEPAGGPAGPDAAAEEAAVLGLEADGDRVVMLSVIPGEAEDNLSPEPGGGDGTCGAGGQEDSRCHLRESLFSLDSSGSFPEREEEYYTEPEVADSDPAPAEDANATESLKPPKVTCEERNVSGLENFTLKILNVSQDLMDFLNPNGSDCTLVLFYTPWCRFSASLAPHFNSLPRAFPALHFLALDASQHSSLSTRFGTVAVPNILLFQGAKPMARFNHTDRTLETLKIFIFNQTGIEAKKNVVVTQADHIGPLPSTLIKSVDWLLVFSLFFLISFIMYATIRTESIRWLIPGQEQDHAE
ncbi:thioredoxin domain-containing protein 15 [Phacochoerus africanus]|uniref:thioredoxin domain-containing protein 15 n=1 Tax=Phacochoerus africanus TaxID=41426 RepID=UPI001FD9FFA2|nr:thioredoxin domain-containing protein 15 [Phacochoerus africanus]